MNLDGESNLKNRYARQETSVVAEGGIVSGLVRCEQPNMNIYEFTANMEFRGHRFPLSQSNIILRGCQFKNTEWVIGVVVYIGQETKAMLNSAASHAKRSKLESHMNRETLWLSVFLLIMCSIVALGMDCGFNATSSSSTCYLTIGRDILQVEERKEKITNIWGCYGDFLCFLEFHYSLPDNATNLPLYHMELVRLGQSYFMIGDKHMYDSSSDSRF